MQHSEFRMTKGMQLTRNTVLLRTPDPTSVTAPACAPHLQAAPQPTCPATHTQLLLHAGRCHSARAAAACCATAGSLCLSKCCRTWRHTGSSTVACTPGNQCSKVSTCATVCQQPRDPCESTHDTLDCCCTSGMILRPSVCINIGVTPKLGAHSQGRIVSAAPITETCQLLEVCQLLQHTAILTGVPHFYINQSGQLTQQLQPLW